LLFFCDFSTIVLWIFKFCRDYGVDFSLVMIDVILDSINIFLDKELMEACSSIYNCALVPFFPGVLLEDTLEGVF